MHDLFVVTCVKLIYGTLACLLDTTQVVLMYISRRTHTWFDQLANHATLGFALMRGEPTLFLTPSLWGRGSADDGS